ncbi:MAG TPA: type II secretion system protein GspD [Deltaproteobacteria bacterium]|nr:type II secretion system protein GspD [Deltaproteobacteria bacterium]
MTLTHKQKARPAAETAAKAVRSARGIFLAVAAALALMAAAPASSWCAERGKGDDNARYTINFVDVELSTLVKVISEITGKNFIYDTNLKGKVTVVSQARLTEDEAFNLFASALELKNFTLLPTAGAYKIVPSALIKQSGGKFVDEHTPALADESYVVRLITLEHISTAEALPVLRPFISRNGYLAAFGSRNALLAFDTALNVDKIAAIVRAVDVESEDVTPEIVYLKNARVEAIAPVLKQEEQRRSAAKGGAAAPGAQRLTVLPDKRLNAVVLLGPESQTREMRKLIEMLDLPSPETASAINVYYLENADAEEMAKVLEGLLKPKAASKQPGAPPIELPREFSGPIAITPDKTTNALVVMASPEDYKSLLSVIWKLDRRPKQVYVEAMITEVSIDKALELGNTWRYTGTKGGRPIAIGGLGTIDSSAVQSVMSGLAGLTVGGLGNFLSVPYTAPDGTVKTLSAPGFAMLFSLNQFKDVVNVLSTPHILTSDNIEAEIMVGENVPFLGQFERQPTTTNQPLLQSIQRKDVGITLRIKPKISEGGFVRLDIFQEISAVAPKTVASQAGATDLITTKRSARTEVVVQDRQTVVIGGLIQEKTTDNITKIPLLGDIPFIGSLFRYKKEEKRKTNLLVFITPYIIEDFEDLERLRNRKIEEFSEAMPPGGRPGAPTDRPPSQGGAEESGGSSGAAPAAGTAFTAAAAEPDLNDEFYEFY